MVSELRKNKLNYVFDTFFDINQDGSIERNDFDMAIENISKLRGYKAGGPRHKDTSDSFLSIWEKLRQHADTNKDNAVSREEWIALWAEAGGPNEDWKNLYKDFMFRLQDANADGSIDADEFITVTNTFGVPKEEATKAFAKISNDGKTEITPAFYATLWKEFFSADDAAALGNNIFGKTSFP
jgi:Ca2+-binding EF-hand superfamily protein